MLRFLLYRLAVLIPTFIGVSLVAFAFIRLIPGDPILLLAGERGMSEERYTELQALYGFNKPIAVQYFNYLTDILSGDFGTSTVTKRPVLEEFLTRLPATNVQVITSTVPASGTLFLLIASLFGWLALRVSATPHVKPM